MKKYKTSILLTEEEQQELVSLRSKLEEVLKRPLSMKEAFKIALKYIKQKIEGGELEEIIKIASEKKEEN